MLGFGTVAQTTFPLILQTMKDEIKEFVIIDGRKLSEKDLEVTKGVEVKVIELQLNKENMDEQINKVIEDNDMVFDFTCCCDSIQIIVAIAEHKKNVVYINTSLEEWEGEELEIQNDLYDKIRTYKDKVKATAAVDCGANPGAITHFAIMALYGMAKSAIERKVKDYEQIKEYLKKKSIPDLAAILQVDVVHISEREEIFPAQAEKLKGYGISSWGVGSFQWEWHMCGEVSMGNNDEKDLTQPGYEMMPGGVPHFVQTPYPLFLRSANPKGIFTGRLVRHPETMEIAQLFYDPKTGHTPTVGFVYNPSMITKDVYRDDSWKDLPRLVFTEQNAGPLEGYESMGALLISAREDIPMRYYGSIITCEESRKLGCIMNGVTMQVAASALAHMRVALRHPEMGLCMPGNFDSEEIMEMAAPYLGTVWDGDLKERLPTHWNELISDEASMDKEYIKAE